MSKEKSSKLKVQHLTPGMLVFVSGGPDDPLPLTNELSKRFARDITHNRIVHFCKVVLKWTYDNGTFHTGCLLEFPKECLPDPVANQEALAEARKLLRREGP